MSQGRHSMLTVEITMAEEHMLVALMRRRKLPVAYVRRLQCVLLRFRGLPISTIAIRVGLSRRHTYKWLRRWNAAGLPGLQDQRKPGHTGGTT